MYLYHAYLIVLELSEITLNHRNKSLYINSLIFLLILIFYLYSILYISSPTKNL